MSVSYPHASRSPLPGLPGLPGSSGGAGAGRLLAPILPATVRVVEAYVDPPDPPLFPEEEAVVARAVTKRRREFATVRLCARAALAELGVPPAAIVPGPRGAPSWPTPVVGSMTHCTGYRAAAVALRRDMIAIGVDAEPDTPLPAGILDAVSLPAERIRLDRLRAADPTIAWDRLLFCAKESIYKIWSPTTGQPLGFTDATVDLRRDGAFTARLLVAGPAGCPPAGTEIEGRWLTRAGFAVTALTVPANDRLWSVPHRLTVH